MSVLGRKWFLFKQAEIPKIGIPLRDWLLSSHRTKVGSHSLERQTPSADYSDPADMSVPP